MTSKPDFIEEGGTAYLKTSHNATLVKVLEVVRAAARVEWPDGRKRTVRFNELAPDPDYMERRDQKEAERQKRLADERAPKPLTHNIVIPPPRAAPPLALVPKPAEHKLIPKAELSMSEITRRMAELMRWWMKKHHDNKRGCVTRVEEALGITNASNYLSGRHVMSLKYATEALSRIGWDERYLRLAEFVPPDVYTPAEVPASTAVASTTRVGGSESPQPKPAAERTTNDDSFDEDLKAWLEMSPIGTLDRKIGETLKRVTEKEAELAADRKRLDELCAKRKRLAALAELENFEDAAAE